MCPILSVLVAAPSSAELNQPNLLVSNYLFSSLSLPLSLSKKRLLSALYRLPRLHLMAIQVPIGAWLAMLILQNSLWIAHCCTDSALPSQPISLHKPFRYSTGTSLFRFWSSEGSLRRTAKVQKKEICWENFIKKTHQEDFTEENQVFKI